MEFKGRKDFSHAASPKVGVLVVNLGTPDAPTPSALRSYLREFLSDPRVIELPKLLWWFLLNFVVLVKRPKESAKLYAEVWTKEGSPLLLYTKSITEKLSERLVGVIGNPVVVEMGMRYGNPSIASALEKLKNENVQKLLFVPLYGQYSATTAGSTFDALVDELKTWRWVPDVRTVMQFHDDPGYIAALASNVRRARSEGFKAEKLVMSFHGIPKRYFLNGDPYHCHCHKTGRLLAEELGLSEDEYIVTFQSVFGKEEWIKPATDKTIIQLAESGVKSIDVICPGFIADCLETLEEIDVQNREFFMEHGGENFRYIPCVNDSQEFIDALGKIVISNLAGWVCSKEQWRGEEALRKQAQTNERFKRLETKQGQPGGQHEVKLSKAANQ